MAEGKKPRKGIRSRFKTGRDAQEQLRQIESAQKAARLRRIKAKIDSIEKSRQRLMNKLDAIKDADDAINEFD
jgi:hypothetical protein